MIWKEEIKDLKTSTVRDSNLFIKQYCLIVWSVKRDRKKVGSRGLQWQIKEN